MALFGMKICMVVLCVWILRRSQKLGWVTLLASCRTLKNHRALHWEHNWRSPGGLQTPHWGVGRRCHRHGQLAHSPLQESGSATASGCAINGGISGAHAHHASQQGARPTRSYIQIAHSALMPERELFRKDWEASAALCLESSSSVCLASGGAADAGV